jgi:hypothetical protein
MKDQQLPDSDQQNNPRLALARETAIFQIKLLADGIRDALLIPISLVAGALGILRGGEGCDREFREVIRLGRRSERWINLFGHEKPLGMEHPAGSMDRILEQVEAVVIEQYKKGKSASEVRDAVRKSMQEGEKQSGETQ